MGSRFFVGARQSRMETNHSHLALIALMTLSLYALDIEADGNCD
jgi:hypothetical protein